MRQNPLLRASVAVLVIICGSAVANAQCPDPPSDLILVTEMANDGSNTFVELHNPGLAEVNLTGWWICINPGFAYAPIAIDESDALASGGVLVLQLGGELDENYGDRLIVTGPLELAMGDFALYFSTEFFPDFESPDDIREYLQWGASGQNREEVADAACLWTAGDFVASSLSRTSLQLDPQATGGRLTASADYDVLDFAFHSLGEFPPSPVGEGACCFPDDICVEGVDDADCDLIGGFYLGDGSACDGDEDGDGVVGCDDLCPGTPPGTPVDENGCPTIGACCFADVGVCLDGLDEETCAGIDGDYVGGGSFCDDPDTCPSICEGDANGDGIVDPLDSGFVLARFGCPVGTGDPGCDAADQNGDGLVDPLDSGFVLARFGDCP